jgi:hypothetical protein
MENFRYLFKKSGKVTPIEAISPGSEVGPLTDIGSESATDNSFNSTQAGQKSSEPAKSTKDALISAQTAQNCSIDKSEAFLEAKEQSESDQSAYELRNNILPEHTSQVEADQAIATYQANRYIHEVEANATTTENGKSIDGAKDDTPQQTHHIDCMD